MINKNKRLLLLFFLIGIGFNCQNKKLIESPKTNENPIHFYQIKTDSLFNSPQIISIITLDNMDLNQYQIDFAYNSSALKTTSTFAKEENALAAINGSYFDRDDGGSVTYFEKNDQVIHKTRQGPAKWSIPSSMINGAIVLTTTSELKIQSSKTELFYETSKEEKGVMISGPLLLSHTKKVELPDKEFTFKRHPRTCLCTTSEAILFITIDGRSKNAAGMNLIEAQTFLLNLGCIDAINLDGGGSTTMWIKDKGIINSPSDFFGERTVANALLIKEKGE